MTFDRFRMEGYLSAIENALEYISKRGFRESNYEINEVIKWLKEEKKIIETHLKY